MRHSSASWPVVAPLPAGFVAVSPVGVFGFRAFIQDSWGWKGAL